MLQNIFKKKQGTGRIVTEDTQTMPIKYRTAQAGARPVDYVFSRQMKKLLNQMNRDIDQLIAEGIIDYYTELSVFDGLIDSYYQLLVNDVERQSLQHKMAIHSIIGEIRTALKECREIRSVGSALLSEQEILQQEERGDEDYEKEK